MKPLCVLLLAALAVFGQGIASRGVKPSVRGKPSGRPFHTRFVDVAKEAGLTQPTVYGGVERVNYLLETSAGGVAFVDFDGDGWADIFLTNGTRLENPPKDATNRLYRNRRNGTFEDATDNAGLRRTGWASGVAVGDFDNDGLTDLFVTYWGESVLYRNRGDGTFADITAESGLRRQAQRPLWDSGAVFTDYDRDGRLDLFVTSYVDMDLARTPKPGENPNCNWKGVAVACGPRGLKPGRSWLFHNEGNGKFADVSQKAGVTGPTNCFGMTAIAADFDDDAWPDVYVACDSTPSLLFRNQHDGTFAEEGIERGVALNEDGKEQAGMGLAWGDYNVDGKPDLLKTHFADDTHILYSGEGNGMYRETTLAAGLGVETRYVGWGTGMEDFDNDGLLDILIVTGNVYPETQKELPGYPYLSPRLLFRNLGGGRLEQLMEEAGPGITSAHSSRGAAFADYDHDGDVDVIIWNRNEPPSLLRNDLKAANRNWLQIKLTGTRSNRSAIGARVIVRYSGRVQVREVMGSASFYSANEMALHFGLGEAVASVDVLIRWPDGKTSERRGVKANQRLEIREE